MINNREPYHISRPLSPFPSPPAMNLKTAGKYLARVLSFQATTFEVVTTGFDDKFTQRYDQATVSAGDRWWCCCCCCCMSSLPSCRAEGLMLCGWVGFGVIIYHSSSGTRCSRSSRFLRMMQMGWGKLGMRITRKPQTIPRSI